MISSPVEFLRAVVPHKALLVGDSRTVNTGDVFCAVPGTCNDGRDHIGMAISRGVTAVLWESVSGTWQSDWQVPNLAVSNLRDQLGDIASSYYDEPSKQLKVIAVTGTNGKTTVANWCAQLLCASGMPAGYVGTLGAGVGDKYTPLGMTTPDPLQLQRLFVDFVAQGCQAVALEASSEGLVQLRLAGVECDVAVFTNLGRDHLDYHVNESAYLEAKCLLFQRPELQVAVINVDDQHAGTVSATSVAPVVRCGSDANCDMRFTIDTPPVGGALGTLTYQGKRLEFRLPVLGVFNANNLALAAAAGMNAGMSWDDLARALPSLRGIPGRLQRLGSGASYVDYAHTPEALQETLQTLRACHPGALVYCVFGCGGERDNGKRPLMGAVAAEFADQVIITNDNPRDEDPYAIVAAIIAGMPAAPTVELDRARAIELAVANARADDVILVAGKGHETGIELAGEQLPFDDAQVLAAALEQA